MRCFDCKYYFSKTCHRYPPVNHTGIFPSVNDNDFCGEFFSSFSADSVKLQEPVEAATDKRFIETTKFNLKPGIENAR